MAIPLRCLLLLACLGAGCRTHFIYRIDRFTGEDPAFATPPIELDHRAVQARPRSDPQKALALAISGGGHRAANFATGVLLGLEEQGLLREVDYLSTVSGGGFAAGTYLSLLHDHAGDAPFSLREALAGEPRAGHALRRNYEDLLYTGGFDLRLVGSRDRGDLLEKRFDDGLLGHARRHPPHSLQLGDLERPDLPRWIPNATIYENGARFPFVPNVIRAYGVESCIHRMRACAIETGHDMPLALAAKASASFPAAIPATTLKLRRAKGERSYLHLIDGGVADNLGIQTAVEVLRADPSREKVLLVIDAFNLEDDPWSEKGVSPNMLQTGIKLTKLLLETRHAQLAADIEEYEREIPGLRIIHLCFAEATPNEELPLEFITAFQQAFPASRSFASGEQRIGPGVWNSLKWSLTVNQKSRLMRLFEEHQLFHLVRFVPTTLSINEEEQHFLMRAGAHAVKTQRTAIDAAWNRPLSRSAP